MEKNWSLTISTAKSNLHHIPMLISEPEKFRVTVKSGLVIIRTLKMRYHQPSFSTDKGKWHFASD